MTRKAAISSSALHDRLVALLDDAVAEAGALRLWRGMGLSESDERMEEFIEDLADGIRSLSRLPHSDTGSRL